MRSKDKALLQAVVRTLDSVPVQGLENMDKILGCANVLRQVIAETEPGEAAAASAEK